MNNNYEKEPMTIKSMRIAIETKNTLNEIKRIERINTDDELMEYLIMAVDFAIRSGAKFRKSEISRNEGYSKLIATYKNSR